jgi:hypothetical protein
MTRSGLAFLLLFGLWPLAAGGCSLIVDFDPKLLLDAGVDAGVDAGPDAGPDGSVDAAVAAEER